ncbi:OLC1v1031378C1 [Oldenlandia corymbosa var. corymbosa]|uniref:OLC1v1031378C1 n=1 Tax=Oldenlandia corymbosa var. corymbosa TaxID=529605 RepID=A0AAV1CIR0_OLDCO|nr:OLC1v1031378C1 [Oldenlandia corymbosa var. corymbosa]
MAAQNLTPIILKPAQASSMSRCTIFHSLPKSTLPRTRITPRINQVRFFKPISSALSDPYVLQLAETLEDSLPSTSSPPPPLQKLRDYSSESLLSTSWPSRKDEPFRFTDTSFIKNSRILPIESPQYQSLTSLVDSTETLVPGLTVVDGYLVNDLSLLTELPDGVYVGGLSMLNSEAIMKRVSEYVSSFQGDLFWSLNGVGAPELILVYVPEGCKVEKPLHLRYVSVKGEEKESKTLPVSNPRVLVLVEKGGEIGIIEEYVNGDGDHCYWTNAVMDVVIGEGAKVNHSYIQTQSLGAAHTKWTSVRQESNSIYKLTEVSTGGKLSRHNLHVQQYGPDTVTEFSTFHVALGDQTQDLHSKLILDHPRGFSRQLHKCIVAHSSAQAVFDGNVQVNRYSLLVNPQL